jgi:3-hydroxyacyl-[acyl-carrier-protein] dehydratase
LQTPHPTAKTLLQRARLVKFNLIDRIEEVSDNRLVAVKYVSLAEEYLADHFPTFPVLPGVMMLEAMTQAAGWLLHRKSGFAKSIAVLKEARNVKYGTFVAPGNALRIEVEPIKFTETGGSFKTSGTVNGNNAVSARLEMAYFNLAQRQPNMDEQIDRKLIEHNRARWALLNQSGNPAIT